MLRPLRFLKQRLTPHSEEERNIFFLYVEIVFASMLAVAASFNSAYILRLGGSNTLVGLLSSLPALVAAALYIPSARVLERKARVMPWMISSLSAARIGYLIIPILPLVLTRWVPEATVALLVAMTAPSAFFATTWSPLLADVVPPRMRATVLSWRSILSSCTIAPLIYLAGLWLNTMSFPRNYQGLYLFGLVGGVVSTVLVSRLRLPEQNQSPAHGALPVPEREPALRALWTLLRENRPFARIVANTLFFDFAAWMVGPLYVILFVRQLGATDGWLGLQGTLAHVGVILGYWVWRHLIRRWGETRTLLISLPMCVIYPFLVSLYPNLTFILFAAFLINAISPGVSLSHSVIFLALLPNNKKHTATALYSAVMNVGAFVAPLIGVAISNAIGIIPTLLLGGTLRLAGAGLFYLRPVTMPTMDEAREAPRPNTIEG